MLAVLRAVDVELALGLAAEIVVAEFDVAAEIVAEQVVGRIVHSSLIPHHRPPSLLEIAQPTTACHQ